jgi:hypothetical protein
MGARKAKEGTGRTIEDAPKLSNSSMENSEEGEGGGSNATS